MPSEPEHQEEVHLRDAELEVLAGRAGLPAQQSGAFRLEVWELARRVDADLVDPTAEVGGDGDVWGDGDQPLAESWDALDLGQQAAERLLGGRLRHVAQPERGRDLLRGDQRGGDLLVDASEALGGGPAEAAFDGVLGEAVPLAAVGDAQGLLRSSAICSSVSSAEWFIGWPAIGRPQPLMV